VKQKVSWRQPSSELGCRAKGKKKTLNNIGRETIRHFRNKKMEYLKDKIDELARNSKNKNIETCVEE
jgi:hypothetical protein